MKRRILASVPLGTVREELDRNYRELASTVQIPGFRRGRVPRRLLEKRFGDDINSDVKDNLLSESFQELLQELDLKVFGSPRFDNIQFDEQQDFTYEVELEVQPEFALPEYKGMKVEREVIPLDEKTIDEQLENLRREHQQLLPIDPDSATAEDHFLGRYELYADGSRVKVQEDVQFQPSTGRLAEFMIEDLADRVDSWKRADNQPLTVETRVPAGYADEMLRDKEVELRFFLGEARKVELPPLDDEFARRVGRENLEQARKDIRENLEERNRRLGDRKIEQKLVDQLIGETEFEIPDDIVERHLERARKGENRQGSADATEEGGESKEAEEKEDDQDEGGEGAREGRKGEEGEGEEGEGKAKDLPTKEDVRRQLKEFFILERIAEKEKIFATEDEVREHVKVMAALYGTDGNMLLESLRGSGGLDEIRASLRNNKLKAFLRKKATVIEPGGLEPGGKESSTQESDSEEPGD